MTWLIVYRGFVICIGRHRVRMHEIRIKDYGRYGIEFEEDTLEFMDTVNTFNISTRYPDEKLKFYKMCTREFTEENFYRIKEIYKCLLQKIKL